MGTAPRANRNPQKPFLKRDVRLAMWGLFFGLLASTVGGDLFRWVLWAFCLSLFLVLGWDWTQSRWPVWVRLTTVIVVSAAFLFVAIPNVLEYMQPSFPVVRPISPVAGKSNMFDIGEMGHEILYDVEIIFRDDDRFAAMDTNPQFFNQAIIRMHFDELDPGGTLVDKLLPFVPLNPKIQNYRVGMSFRGVPRPKLDEEMHVVMVGDKWDYVVRVTDLASGKVMLECRDAGYPVSQEWPATLPTCKSVFFPPQPHKTLSAVAQKARDYWISR